MLSPTEVLLGKNLLPVLNLTYFVWNKFNGYRLAGRKNWDAKRTQYFRLTNSGGRGFRFSNTRHKELSCGGTLVFFLAS
jgi:hypothetical protein